MGLRRAEKDLARLQKNVDTRVEALQRELGERHAAFTVRLTLRVQCEALQLACFPPSPLHSYTNTTPLVHSTT